MRNAGVNWPPRQVRAPNLAHRERGAAVRRGRTAIRSPRVLRIGPLPPADAEITIS